MPVCFRRSELSLILSLYSQRVASGEWRDYAIDHGQGRAVFAVFRHSMAQPLFTIIKHGDGAWEIFHGPRSLMQADSLDKALSVFGRELRIVA